jgi:sugar phosphate isomerase/epimerase
VDLARRVGSPFARVSSGFYRNEVEDMSTIRHHQDFLIETFRKFLAEHPNAQVPVLLENHSDFTPEEYSEILSAIGSDRVAVFLDVINPVTMLMDPLPVVKALAPMALAGHVKDFRMVSHYVEDGFHRRGFDVQYCYPGEGMTALDSLIAALPREAGKTYYLSIEGLDNHPGVADQRFRLSASATRLRPLIAS